MEECISLEGGKYDIIHGYDELLLAGLTYGIKAAIGTTYNFMAPLYLEMMKRFREKDLEKALELQQKANRLISVMLGTGSAISGGKVMMRLVEIDCGPCRAPLNNLEEGQQLLFEDELRKAGYFNLFQV